MGLTAFITAILFMFALAGCESGAALDPGRPAETVTAVNESGPGGGEHGGNGATSGEHGGGGESGEHGGNGESGEHGDGASGESGGGEESATQYGLDDAYDEVRAGARLVLAYDRAANAFTGTVTNTTAGTLRRVRVEVHLSNGIELGPTAPLDLAPGESAAVRLEASDRPFAAWSAHPEAG